MELACNDVETELRCIYCVVAWRGTGVTTKERNGVGWY